MATVAMGSTGHGAMADGGTVSYVVRVNGRAVGWVGDARSWLGDRHGARTWWACHREDGDEHARWRSGPLATRFAALDELVARTT